jgi:hypothetical protein
MPTLRVALIKLETLTKCLCFNAVTGQFLSRLARRHCPAGAVAGYVNAEGFVIITLAGTQCLGHDVAWLWDRGAWPEKMLEHVDGHRTDNRIKNLRFRG